ncbi:MAG: 2-hydroxyacid dehydrogenase [Planctomycetota bacterium]|jgi:glyoxylate reductase
MAKLPFTAVLTIPLPKTLRRKLDGRFRRVVRTTDLSKGDGAFCLLREPIDAAAMERAPRLKVLSLMAVGYNNVDVREATRRGILVTNTPGVLTETAADLAFGLLLATARRIVECDRDVREGRFSGWGAFKWLGKDVHGATLGIVGPGRIGKAVARRARGFGMKVLFADKRRSELERVLKRSDFVSLHCPLTPETHRLIGAPELALMKRSAMLVNTSRGEVVDEKALVRALGAGKIAGAGLDVFENEPKVARALLRRKNVVVLPHIGSASWDTRSGMAELAIRNLVAGLSGRRPPHPVNPEVLPKLRRNLAAKSSKLTRPN